VSGQEPIESGEAQEVQPWEPQRMLRRISELEAALSRGFLRCRPEKWFPGLSTQWMPVAHAFGCEIAVTDIKPVLAEPPSSDAAFVGVVSGEEMTLVLDADSSSAMLGEALPGTDGFAASVAQEYLMRRLFYSLVTSWTGPEISSVSFQGRLASQPVRTAGSVKVTCSLNTSQVVIWFGLGERMLATLDGLWRRQVQSTARAGDGSSQIRLEVAQLGVPPQMLSDYLKPGTVIDLEVRASDMLTVRAGGKAWMPGRMVNVNGKLGCEIVPGAVAAPSVAEGTTRLSIELGNLPVEGSQIAEFGQVGAVIVTGTQIGQEVVLSINQEPVGRARLCVYEGRFAIEVIP